MKKFRKKEKMKEKAQSLIEFVIVIPLLIVILFGIMEMAMFWRAVQTVQQIALEAGVIASGQTTYTSGPNTAVDKAANFVQGRVKSLGINGLVLTKTILTDPADQPFAAYQFKGGTAPNGQPLIVLVIDSRNPVTKGIVTQLTYQYRTLLLGLEFNVPGGKTISILSRDIPISSTKIQEYQVF